MLSRRLGRVQRRKPHERDFTVAKRQRFLDALSLTCNIARSAVHAGVCHATIYKTRARDAVFAEQMSSALEIGTDRLEALVLEHGGAGMPIDPDPERAEAEGADGTASQGDDPPPFDFDRAMRVLAHRRATVAAAARRTGRPVRNATREETNAALMKALAAADKRLAKEAAKEAAKRGQ